MRPKLINRLAFLKSCKWNRTYNPTVPVIVLLAIYVAVPGEAGQFGVQSQFALTALQTMHVPLFVHGQQVVPVQDSNSAPRAETRIIVLQFVEYGLK